MKVERNVDEYQMIHSLANERSCSVDGVILSLGITSGLNGYIPHFINPDLME